MRDEWGRSGQIRCDSRVPTCVDHVSDRGQIQSLSLVLALALLCQIFPGGQRISKVGCLYVCGSISVYEEEDDD